MTVRRGRKQVGPQPWDFRRPSSLSREHIRALQLAWETFAKQMGTVLTTRTRAISTASLVSVEQVSYDEYINSLRVPSFLALHSIAPMEGTGIFALEHDTAMRTVDYVLGGSGQGQQPDRNFTEIESTLLRGLADRILHEMTYAFEAIAPIRAAVEGLEANAQFAQVAAPSDGFVVAMFELKLGESEAIASLALPMAPLLPLLDVALARGRRSEDSDSVVRDQLEDRLGEVEVEVNLQFVPVKVPSTVVLDLSVGDVLPLRHLVTDPLVMTSDGVTCARAVAGAQGKNLACLVVEPPASIDPEAQLVKSRPHAHAHAMTRSS